MSDQSPLVIIAGPTASGKSALGLAVAEEFRGTIINADSMQVYRDLEILSARPAPPELARAPHRLYGVIDAAKACSAGRWRALAVEEIAAARGKRRLPILVGGTGLYVRALLEGLAPVPPVPASVREEARALHRRLGGEGFRVALAERDAEAAARLAAGDTQRLIRAWEVVTATGMPLAAWQRQAQPSAGFRTAAVVLLPPRTVLYPACDARLLAMMDQGALDEVQRLLARRLSSLLPAMKAVGVRELARYLEGRSPREAAIAAAQQATRRYAKRQYTWFRHQLPESERLRRLTIEAQFSESLMPEIFAFIRRCLLTARN